MYFYLCSFETDKRAMLDLDVEDPVQARYLRIILSWPLQFFTKCVKASDCGGPPGPLPRLPVPKVGTAKVTTLQVIKLMGSHWVIQVQF